MNFLTTFCAILLLAALTGFIFLWAGITVELMVEYFFHNKSVRLFTLIGLGIGFGGGCLGIYLRGKENHGR